MWSVGAERCLRVKNHPSRNDKTTVPLVPREKLATRAVARATPIRLVQPRDPTVAGNQPHSLRKWKVGWKAILNEAVTVKLAGTVLRCCDHGVGSTWRRCDRGPEVAQDIIPLAVEWNSARRQQRSLAESGKIRSSPKRTSC